MPESSESPMRARRRDPNIVRFLRGLETALSTRAGDPAVPSAIATVQTALQSAGDDDSSSAVRLPVCAHVASALEAARAFSEPMAALADGFAAIEPRLRWARRPVGGPSASENWPDGHANAMIIGPVGFERREDMQIGVSLLAPNVRYPDHNHLPEEVYIVLSPGRFKHGASSWFRPGVGGTFHNVPNVTHAMASDDAPLLAIWTLWNS